MTISDLQDITVENVLVDDIYKSTKVQIPKPELYVLYTGDRKPRPSEITLGKEFFPDEADIAIDVKVEMY